jgi:peroxiredoxin Q/BCP
MAGLLAIGSPAPDFNLPRDGGDQISLKKLQGKKVVLFFYPKADTPGCTKEVIAFNGMKHAFEQVGTAILGVSADPVRTQDKFRDKYALTFPLISDEAHQMLEAYGVWGEKSMYGKTYMGIERVTYLIDGNGKIAKVWPKVKVDGHAQEVFEAAKLL